MPTSPLRHCGLSTPGHSPHFIQAKRALANRHPRLLTVVAVTATGVDVTEGTAVEHWRLHPAGRAIVGDALERGVTHLHDQGTSFAVVGGIGVSYCADDLQWHECSSQDVNRGGPVSHFRLDGYDARVSCPAEARDLAASSLVPGMWLIVT
ncbi:hypothetical protein [Demequina subtropica]|uniref:hypothetical protein n=1 Tax=Demequina subtropica TaxID=1638989 RepID=UPI000785B97A|nr:hypothetical protein [Demequina subtropica]